MARLPDGKLVQLIDGEIVLFEERGYTQHTYVSVPADDVDAIAKAQKTIYDLDMSPEAKSFAHFWFGYLYGSQR